MTYFRSEEHLRKWVGFTSDKEGGIVPISELAESFSVDLFRRRLDSDYVSNYRDYSRGFMAKLGRDGEEGAVLVAVGLAPLVVLLELEKCSK